MILAATAGHDKVCEILLDHSADIEAQSERTKDTPLSLACSGGRYEVVEVLLRRNANKEHRNVSDYTPLALAASGGYVTIIKLLLAHGAEINSRTGSKLGISPLVSFSFYLLKFNALLYGKKTKYLSITSSKRISTYKRESEFFGNFLRIFCQFFEEIF